MGATLIVRGARLATMSGPQAAAGDAPLGLIDDGALLAAGPRITWVGRTDELPAATVAA